MNIHSKIPHGLLRSGRARSPACPVLGLKGLGYVPIVGTCADLDGGGRSLAFFAAAAHPPRRESWHLSPDAKSGRHADAFDARQFSQASAFAANQTGVLRANVVQLQYVRVSHGVERARPSAPGRDLPAPRRRAI